MARFQEIICSPSFKYFKLKILLMTFLTLVLHFLMKHRTPYHITSATRAGQNYCRSMQRCSQNPFTMQSSDVIKISTTSVFPSSTCGDYGLGSYGDLDSHDPYSDYGHDFDHDVDIHHADNGCGHGGYRT